MYFCRREMLWKRVRRCAIGSETIQNEAEGTHPNRGSGNNTERERLRGNVKATEKPSVGTHVFWIFETCLQP